MTVIVTTLLAGCAHQGPTIYGVEADGEPAGPIGELHGRQVFLYSGQICMIEGNNHTKLRSGRDAVLAGDQLIITNQPDFGGAGDW